MNIALLNVRIEIQKNATITDRYGNHKNMWEPYLLCYATVSGETPQEDTEAGLVVDDSRVDFTIRWFAASSMITSAGYRVVFQDEIYDILGVNHMNCKTKSIKRQMKAKSPSTILSTVMKLSLIRMNGMLFKQSCSEGKPWAGNIVGRASFLSELSAETVDRITGQRCGIQTRCTAKSSGNATTNSNAMCFVPRLISMRKI